MTTLGEDYPLYSMVTKWAAEYKCGSETLEDYPRPGGPVTITTQAPITKIRDIMVDRPVTERYFTSKLGISQEHIHAVVYNELQMSKVADRWVPELLGPE